MIRKHSENKNVKSEEVAVGIYICIYISRIF